MTDQMVALTETTDISLEAMKRPALHLLSGGAKSKSRDSKLIENLMVNFLLDHIMETEADEVPGRCSSMNSQTSGKISGIGDTLSIIRKTR
ncbi:MAG: hypothetical protein U0105_10880 [Candidatus Obscuribacterales bacterium]